jgi:hypothetical protein
MDVKITKALTEVERYVLNILESGAAKPDELTKIAKLCNVTEIQVMVALQQKQLCLSKGSFLNKLCHFVSNIVK